MDYADLIAIICSRYRMLKSVSLLSGCFLIWSRPLTRRDKTVQQFELKIVVVALMLLSASSGTIAAAQAKDSGGLASVGGGAVVSGTVRDAQGVVLMGALIQI